jgi:glycosyltransferase involved in cell wall biosynthesis
MHVSPHKKIKLGIDAKWFFEGPPSGRVVVRNLVNEMIKNNDNRFELYLLLTRKAKKQAEAYFPAEVHLVFLPGVSNLLSNMFILPFVAWQYGIEVMLFQNFGSVWPKKLYKIAYIHDVLFLDYPQYYSKTELLYFKNMKRLAASANKIITISASERERLTVNKVADKDDIEVVYHGINSNFKTTCCYPEGYIDQALKQYHLPQKFLLYVGRVNIRKNLLNLIKALPLINDREIKLVIVGERLTIDTELNEYIKTNGLTNRILFTGHVPEDDLYLIYARATVFCFPSYAEGFGLPPLEAMQCGIPVVVSNRTAMPEVCGSAAVYIDPDSETDIAKQINALLSDTELYNHKAEAGIEHAKQFTWDRSARQILTLIDNAYAN